MKQSEIGTSDPILSLLLLSISISPSLLSAIFYFMIDFPVLRLVASNCTLIFYPFDD